MLAITPTGSVKITGAGAGGDKGDNDATVIDASQLNAPFIQMATLPTKGTRKVGDVTVYDIDGVEISNVKIDGLKTQLFYANKQQYLLKNLTFDNSVLLIKGAQEKTIFDFNSGGNVKDFAVKNSTIYADDATTWKWWILQHTV